MMMSVDAAHGPTAPPPPPVATAVGWIALLQEDDPQLRGHALQQLLHAVDSLWHEVAESLPDLEAMAEDEGLPVEHRQLAAAVASRVFFHLEEPAQALRLALIAGERHFAVSRESSSPYVERLVAAALDAYVAARRREFGDEEEEMLEEKKGEGGEEAPLTAAQLQPMVSRLVEAACAAGQHGVAVGVALEAREAERFGRVLEAAGPDLYPYAADTVLRTCQGKAFRLAALQVLAAFVRTEFDRKPAKAAYQLALIHQLVGDSAQVADVLTQLLSSETEDEALTGLQLCFDLMDSGDQAFVTAVATKLDENKPEGDDQRKDRWESAAKVLTGGFSSELALSFLHKQSHADRLIMDNLKKSLEDRSSGSRSSVLHNTAVLTHSYLNAGTTNDSFLRDHLDWMKKASNWAKFSATASLGVIHASHVTEAMHLLQPYLPDNPTEGGTVTTTGGYSEGGALYALGLIHGSSAGSSAEQRMETTDFLRNHLRASHANEVISHGAALGVGLTAMGTADLTVVNELKELLDTDSAAAGEAAGMAMGMVLVGTGAGNVHNSLTTNKEELAELVAELKNYARETQHEKIIRGIAMGLALMNYGQEDNADAVIEEMRSDRDPIMRYGAQYALALAYCGTGSNKAIRILLHTAVSDVSDDVRMAAVIGLAFVLFKTPDRVPQLVKLLLESFNPHVRYASCMAVGIAMAGTGDAESIALLEPMLDDMTDYVRQGALMGTSMIYMQQSDTCNGRKIRSFRERLATIVTEKHQSTLTKMGAILSTGIIDAGGRNCILALGSRNGFTKMSSAVGLALWLQHWHWYPMMHMFSLALTPTLTIGLNKNFKYPKNFLIKCNARPSAFAYPKKLEEKKEEKKKRVETVALSVTAKEKARLARKRAKLGEKEGAMDVEKEETVAAAAESKEEEVEEKEKEGEAMDVDKEDKEEEPEKKQRKKREPEPTFFTVGNPARITLTQSQVCEFDLTQRYRPIRPDEKPFGVIILTDSTPEEEEDDLGAIKAPSLEPEGELAPPEPFLWTPPPPPAKEETTDETKEEKEETAASSEPTE